MRYLLFLLLPIWSWFTKTPEPKIKLYGTVKDQSSGAILPGCKIFVRYASGISFETSTDLEGKYTLSMMPGSCSLELSMRGYKKSDLSFKFQAKSDTLIQQDFTLTDASISLKEVEVSEPLLMPTLSESHVSYASPSDFSKVSTLSTTTKRRSKDRGASPTTHSFSTGSSSAPSYSGGAYEDVSGGSVSGERATYKSTGTGSDIKAGTLTAGEINDFSKWVLWNDLQQGELKSYVSHWGILPKHRFSILVTNEKKNPLADLQVTLIDPKGKAIWSSHTDNTGKAELWANLYDSTDLQKGNYRIEVVSNGKTHSVAKASPFHEKLNQLVIASECSRPLNLDIVFAVDATGSMGDEISYLQAELTDVIENVKQRNPGLSLKMGSVFYRDKGDAYLTVQQDLTSDIPQVMNFIKAQRADGGGDEPEGVDAALEEAIGKFSWRKEARARVMFLVLDASPHHSVEAMDKLKKYTLLAAEKGIRIVPIVCSGIDKAGEYLMRSMALATNGNYIFLTDHSGIGNLHIAPSTDKYDVETLNELLIRLLQQYVFMPACDQTVNTADLDSLQKSEADSVIRDSTFVKTPDPGKDTTTKSDPATWFLKYYPNPCRGILQVELSAEISELYIADINGKLLMKIPVSREQRHLEIDLSQYPAGIYFLRYCVDEKCKSGKFVLIH